MREKIREILEDNPIITAVKDEAGLEKCLLSESRIVFILFGDICSIPSIVAKVKAADRIAIVHMDLIAGLGNREVAVDFIRENTLADGIITTRAPLLKRAGELGLFTVYRVFVIDSMALAGIERQEKQVRPDLIEILPGVMPKVIQKVCRITRIPVIAGGLISDKEDVMAALLAGAVSISTTNEKVWFL